MKMVAIGTMLSLLACGSQQGVDVPPEPAEPQPQLNVSKKTTVVKPKAVVKPEKPVESPLVVAIKVELAKARSSSAKVAQLLPAEWTVKAPRFVDTSGPVEARTHQILTLCAELIDHDLKYGEYPCASFDQGLKALPAGGKERLEALAQIEILAHRIVLQFTWDVRGRYTAAHWKEMHQFRSRVNRIAKRREERTGEASHLWRHPPADWPESGEAAEAKLLRDVFSRLGTEPLGDVLRSVMPSDEQYPRLVKAHRRYRELVKAGGLTPVPKSNRLKAGRQGKAVSALRQRLIQEGFEPKGENVDPTFFDDNLLAALGKYQQAHQLTAYPSVGRKTVAVLKLSAKQKLGRIRFAMDAWRKTQPRPNYYIQINIPDFHGEIWRDNQRIHRFKTMVGNRKREWDKKKKKKWPNATRPLVSSIDQLVFNPYWNIPIRILEEDILPKPVIPEPITPTPAPVPMGTPSDFVPPPPPPAPVVPPAEPIELTAEEKAEWLTEKGYEVRNRGTRRQYVRQKPGKRNPLGQVKILFPNDQDIYMHDTPRRRLFSRPVRAYSHGCIRVHEPLSVARILLEAEGSWDDDKVKRWLKRDKPTNVKLRNKVPVFIDYIPVRVADDGHAQFLTDIYKEMPKWLRRIPK